MFNIHRGYRRSSSSDEEPGRPPAGHPQPPQGLQLPAAGGGPQRPGLSRTHRVRRALFGRSDPEENIRFVRQELARHRESQSNRWNFDFERGQPLKGRLEWECVEKDQIHPVYKLPRLPYLSSHDESEQENKPGNQSIKTGLTGSVDDLKTPPSSTEPPDSVPCSTNLPPGGLPGSSGTGGIHGSRSVPSGLSNFDTGGGGGGSYVEEGRDQERLSSTQRSYGASYSCLSHTSTDPGGTSIRGSVGLPGHSSSSGSQGSTSRPPDDHRLPPPAGNTSASTQRYSSSSSSHSQSSSAAEAAGNVDSTSSQNKSGDFLRQPQPAAASSRHYSSSQSQPQPFRVPPPSVPSFSGKIQPYVEAESSQAAVLADKKKVEQGSAAMSSTSGAETAVDASASGGGARPKTKEQKITDKFRSRKMSRSKSASKLKRLGGGAAPSRSPSVKARNQSRSALPRS